jgi:hypothetical protein
MGDVKKELKAEELEARIAPKAVPAGPAWGAGAENAQAQTDQSAFGSGGGSSY